MAVKMEWGSTAVLRFYTEAYDYNTDSYIRVIPDKIEAWLETADKEPQRIQQLPFQKEDTGDYLVAFYADKNLVESGKAYYVAFYWDYNGMHQVERELVVVVPDVPKL